MELFKAFVINKLCTVAMATHEHDIAINVMSKWSILKQEATNMQNANHPKCNLIPDPMLCRKPDV